MEESKEKGKKNSKLPLILTVVGFLIIVISFVLFCVLDYNKESPPKEINDEKELTDNTGKKKIDDFLNIIKGSNEYIKYHFVTDTYTSNSNKMYVSIHSIFDKKNYTKITNENIPDKYINDEHYKESINNGCLIQVTFDDIEKEFSNYFEDKIKNNTEDFEFLNDILCFDKEKLFDEELKLMIFNTCTCSEDGSKNEIYLSPYKYTYDDDYNYLYLYVGMKMKEDTSLEFNEVIELTKDKYYKISNNENVDVDSFDGNEDKFDSIKWVFNKNFEFVKAEFIYQ